MERRDLYFENLAGKDYDQSLDFMERRDSYFENLAGKDCRGRLTVF